MTGATGGGTFLSGWPPLRGSTQHPGVPAGGATRPCNMRACAATTSPIELPAELIAQSPLAERSASRLLVLDGATGAVRDPQVRDLPALLRPATCWCSTTRACVAGAPVRHQALAAGASRSSSSGRSAGTRGAGAACGEQADPRRAARSRPPAGRSRCIARAADLWQVAAAGRRRWSSSSAGARCRCRPTFTARPRSAGSRALPEHLCARAGRGGRADRQPAFRCGAAAGARRRAACAERFVTLHVGAGTFQPLRAEDLGRACDARRARDGECGRPARPSRGACRRRAA